MENKITSNFNTTKKGNEKKGLSTSSVNKRNNIFKGKITSTVILAAFMLLILIPIVFMLVTSFKTPLEIRMSGSLFPKNGFTIVNWVKTFESVPIIKYLLNSLVVAFVSTLLVTITALMASYSITRFQTGGPLLPMLILGTYIMPPIVVSLYIFSMIKVLGLADNVIGLSIVHSLLNMPIAVWLIEGHIRRLPEEVEMAAWVDGYGKFGTLFKVVFPIIKPGVISTAVICFLLSWDEFLFALILTYSPKSMTFPVGISQFVGEHGIQFGQMSAAALVGIIPIYICVFLFSKSMLSTITGAAVKR